MTPFGCGCTDNGDERCDDHCEWDCHNPEPASSEPLCPPCRLAVRRSVILDHRATPTKSWSL